MAKNIESEETKKAKRKSVAGKRLAKARHEKEIPLEDIAKELLVSTDVLSNLEKNIFDKVGPPVFVRGYLSQYAKIVDVPQDEILQEYSLIHHSQKTPQITDEKERIFIDLQYVEPKKVIFILLLLLFFGVVWWIMQPSDKIVSSNTIDLFDSSNVKENINDDFPNQNLPEDPAVEDISQSVVEDSSQESEFSNPLFNVEIDMTEEEESPLELNLSMNFIRECWTEVYDGLGDRLYYDLVSADKIITLSGIAPLEILFGANESVEIFINGRNYLVPDIYVRANIARFRIIEDSFGIQFDKLTKFITGNNNFNIVKNSDTITDGEIYYTDVLIDESEKMIDEDTETFIEDRLFNGIEITPPSKYKRGK